MTDNASIPPARTQTDDLAECADKLGRLCQSARDVIKLHRGGRDGRCLECEAPDPCPTKLTILSAHVLDGGAVPA